MTANKLRAQTLTAADFAPFGDVIEVKDGPPLVINQGRCRRFHDLAELDFADGQAGISLFHADIRTRPYVVDMLERHPFGSQCFVPMGRARYLVVVAPDEGDRPGPLMAFVATDDQGVNLHRGTWHGVLAPLSGSGLFTVIDRIGSGTNLQEHWLEVPVSIEIDA